MDGWNGHLNQLTMFLINDGTGSASMRKRVGRSALRFAQGPGRQSGAWAACAAAVAGLPFLALLAPGCNALLHCTDTWDAILMVPRLLFMPAVLMATMLTGSWWAQRRHARVDRVFFTSMDARSDQPDRPPGDLDKQALEQDLAKRTLRGMGQGALLGTVALVPIVLTPVALRRCNPWDLGGALPVCSDPAGWTDMLLAFEVWGTLVAGGVGALMLITRSTSIHPRGLPRPRRRRLRRPLRS